MEYSVREDPRESINWRRHRQGCPHYRERWFVESDPDAGEPMYQVYCLKDTPPETLDEQDKCLSSRNQCWRLVELRHKPASAADIPLASVKRHSPSHS